MRSSIVASLLTCCRCSVPIASARAALCPPPRLPSASSRHPPPPPLPLAPPAPGALTARASAAHPPSPASPGFRPFQQHKSSFLIHSSSFLMQNSSFLMHHDLARPARHLCRLSLLDRRCEQQLRLGLGQEWLQHVRWVGAAVLSQARLERQMFKSRCGRGYYCELLLRWVPCSAVFH